VPGVQLCFDRQGIVTRWRIGDRSITRLRGGVGTIPDSELTQGLRS
jgi:hypothetical protein